MLGPGQLGFPGLILVVFLFGGPILSFVVQWKWRKAMARKEEILRLVAMASEEAERAEIEAAVEFRSSAVSGGGVGSGSFQCAVCYCPTTTRCSRCKAVRYCSGKCQIIHWRQGHKEECHSPSTTVLFNSAGSDFNQKVLLQGEQLEFCNNCLESNSKWPPKPIETFHEECGSSKSNLPSGFSDGKEGGKEAKVGGRGNTNATLEASVGVSNSEVPTSGSSNRSKAAKSNGIAPHIFVTSTNVHSSKLPHSEFSGLVTSVNSFSLSSKSRPKTSSCGAGVIDCGSANSSVSSITCFDRFSEASSCSDDFVEGMNGHGHDVHNNSTRFGDGILFDSEFLPRNGSSMSGKAATYVSTVRSLPTKSSERLPTVYNSQNDDGLPLESKTSESWLSSASEDHLYSSRRAQYASSVKSSMADNTQVAATFSSDVSSKGLKTSAQKVAQQLKVPKLSKHRAFGSRSETLFPFEMFIKLYNWEKAELHPCGLINCGNSCYANAVLQCLAFTQPLTAYLLQGFHSRTCPKKEWCFTCEFEYLVLKAREGKSPVSPIGILSKIKSIGSHLGHGKEEDAHEFLRFAVDSMQSVCLKEAGVNALRPLAEETTLVGLTFGGYLRSKIQCMKCLGKSERHEQMMDLTVEIQGNIGTLEDALSQFTATEILDGENKYQCNRCNSYEKAKKKLTILEAPNVLTIAFKRFQSGKFGKLNKSVRFPETLNLAPYMSGKGDKSPMYRLYAVVVHLDIMNAAFSGHYVCYVKNIQGKWFKIDDSRVKPVQLDRVLSKGAYMLLYARCSPRAPSLTWNGTISNGSKIKQERYSIDIHAISCSRKGTIHRRRSTSAVPRADLPTAHRKHEDRPYCMTFDGRLSFESRDFFNRQIQRMGRIYKMDSSSDSSSLFSCSDEGSCSTESTRDSTSTEDFSDYIFGESGGWHSPWRVAEGPDDPSLLSRRSPLGRLNGHEVGPPETSGCPSFDAEEMLNDKFTRRHQEKSKECLQRKGNPHFLYSDTIKNCRKLTKCGSSSIRDTNTDSERPNVKPSVSLRSTLGRTAPILY